VIRTELVKLVRRPRTWVLVVFLCALPAIVAVFVKATNLAPRPGTGPAFLSAVLDNGALFPAAALAIILPLFLPVSVAVVAGESVAGEAQAGTLRYLLVRPVGRTRLLVAKLLATLAFTLLSVTTVALVSYVVGVSLFGTGEDIASISGTEFTTTGATVRIVLTVLYVGWSMLGVASVALFLSTVTDSPLVAALGAVGVLVASTLLVTLDAASSIQPYLPTRYWLAFVDLYRDPVPTRDLWRGVGIQAAYIGALLAAAWANFTTKDVTS
jgi:ABC-2 type transport system permease protein